MLCSSFSFLTQFLSPQSDVFDSGNLRAQKCFSCLDLCKRLTPYVREQAFPCSSILPFRKLS
ncbi:unnamed protein product [Taenia asiatica]|uniref:Ovule protein n=1 Tax=Taenia asiatica TaxID=60517 RepID=A0A158R6M5_TAEAS|nr:unnamed protein product [Taenia asiatica]